MSRRHRLVIVASHPIQYFVPLYRAVAAESSLDLHVLFASRIGMAGFIDPLMGVVVDWRMDMLGGYSHQFLPEADLIERTSLTEVNNPSVTAALARLKPDIVMVHGYGMLTMLRTLLWCRLRGIPVIMTSDSSTHSTGPGPRRMLKLAILPALLRQYSAFMTISERAENYLAELGVPRTRMFRIPMMLPEHFWQFRCNRRDIRVQTRASLGLHTDDLVLIYAGKLYPGKRVSDIFAAIERLRVRGFEASRLKVLIAGDGWQRAELEAKSDASGVAARFLGFVNIDELPRYYCAADALIHPAELEQYGMVTLESAVLGLPLIVSDRVGAVGATSIARPGENALVYRCGDIDGLASVMSSLLRRETRARMSEASIRISVEHKGPESVTKVAAAVAHCIGAALK
jgi:glycosyltransferase involved in cell wall biosynthesis